ncbi:MAG: c-type cytochrome [Gallionella sp.]|nr:c-type cytochrome [Gallionella sp.]
MRIAIIFLLCICVVISLPVISQAEELASVDELAQGRRIYLDGKLPSGAPLTGVRFGSSVVSGASAACASCHRRSGMGSVEGDVLVPPITGNFLFSPGGDQHLATMDPRVSKRFNQAHEPYTDTSLANAILHGANNSGREMSVLMPRYNLTQPELKALTAYLKQLSMHWSPGVTDDSIRFAMVITPDVDPVRRNALIEMVRIAVNQKNGSTMTAKRSGGKRQHMVSAAEMVLGTERNWQLDVWELQGAPESWGEQLVTRYRSQPVFALVSGISNSTWQPVHDFCEQEQVPCWFPSVALPVMTESPYSLYFSRGVILEAEVLARHLLSQKISPQHLVQVFRDNAEGRAASQALTQALAGSTVTIENRMLKTDGAAEDSLRSVMNTIQGSDAAMLWLRPDDIVALDKAKPVSGAKYYFSAELGQAEYAPFSSAWKPSVRLVYPYELPEMRVANLANFRAWLNIRKLPLVDEAMQSEAFFALNFLTDTVSEMLNNLYRDYLIERAENMMNKREGGKAEQETRDRVALGQAGELERKHGAMTVDEGARIKISSQPGLANRSHGTTIYPHLSLGPGQRFASKGGYIVRFDEGVKDRIIAESAWIIP